MKRKTSPREHKEKKANPNRTLLSFVDSLKADIAAFFEINHPATFRAQDVHDHFGATDKKLRQLVNELMHELHDSGKLLRQNDGTYSLADTAAVETGLVGRVDHVNRNFAFVISEGQETDIYVETDFLKGAQDGDTVRVQVFSDGRARGQRLEGRVTEIVTRGRTEVVGVIEIWPKYALVEPDHRKLYEPIHIPLDQIQKANDGDKVIVKIVQWPSRTRKAEGEVIEVLGKAGDNNAEMHAILAEFGLPNRFPEEVEKEAQAISEVISEDEIARRKDMRGVTTFTIDPVDAKDFDDALSLRYLENGHVEIGVHIADVSHYVLPNTELENEAFRRATSVYLVDRTVPMLPEKLSNGLCSLRPNEDRLAFSAVFEMTTKGKLISEWFGRTVIHSDRRFSYEEAQEVLETSVGDYPEELTLLNTLAKILRKERFKKGAINFETIEVRFRLDENGKPLGIYQKERKDSNKLIEEFMLLANRRVAEFVFGLSKGKTKNTMVYRVHQAPDADKLQSFATFVAKLGYTVEVDDEKQIAKSMNSMLSEVEGKPEQNLIESLAVRTMAKARYTTEDLGHFGLAFRRYSHFTSPIRRYPDVLAHRLLQKYLDGAEAVNKDSLEDACRHSSERERLAAEAERASIKYKQIEYMSSMDHEREFAGIITGVTEFGIFVEITETASEGLIRVSDLGDDFYELDKENYRLVGQRTKKIYTFGDQVKVRVKETNLARRSMDLLLADSPQAGTRSRRIEATKATKAARRGTSSRSGNARGKSKAKSKASSSTGRRKR
ncbi:ribonuclease R [Arundinibacter roseus]|uniref:Ribonuclease R n=1 Tax=Arundinibacter roseus TaxID=2070510 RepID=A0A4R4K0U8_9BACT|nr:ribonuclease R [Arundinibacter roseus]TDB60818.1 ribonuclease R [Arundinibacter roseus]